MLAQPVVLELLEQILQLDLPLQLVAAVAVKTVLLDVLPVDQVVADQGAVVTVTF